jgi:hypothetical protein
MAASEPEIVIVAMARVLNPLFDTVRDFVKKPPTVTEPKAREDGETAISGSPTPVPLSETSIVGLLGSFDAIPRVALFGPTEVGAKVSEISHEPPGKTVEHVFVWLNMEASLPVIEMESTLRSPVPVLDTVQLRFDVLPTMTEPKSVEGQLTEIAGIISVMLIVTPFHDETLIVP